MLNRTPISPLVTEEIALIAPVLTKLALLQYFRDNGHSEKFNTELESAEKLLSNLLLQKKKQGGKALTAFSGQIAALHGALDSAQRETLGFPVAQSPSYTAYHTKHEGKVVTHKSEECPAARHQEPLGRQPSGDDTSVKCQVCVESTQ